MTTQTWDSGLFWDSGLSWDDLAAQYVSLIPSQYASKPNFPRVVAALVKGSVDNQSLLATFPAKFDLDFATGAQLDIIGLWVGQSRNLTIPLAGVYFAFDTDGLGWDQGYWQGPFDPTTGVVSLNDTAYRTLLRAVIQANQWDGSHTGAYESWNTLFGGTPFQVMIEDGGDMTMAYGLLGPAPDAITLALFTGGYLSLKPDGVRLDLIEPSVPNTPFFGFDAETSAVSGWDVGSWATVLATE